MYNTSILTCLNDFIIAGAKSEYFEGHLDSRKGVTVERFLALAQERVRKAVQAHYDSIYEKALIDNPDDGAEEAEKVATNDLNEAILEYLPDLAGMGFTSNIEELISAIFNSNAFAFWTLTMKERFAKFTGMAIPQKVLLHDISGSISEGEAAQEIEEATLIDILESLNSIADDRS